MFCIIQQKIWTIRIWILLLLDIHKISWRIRNAKTESQISNSTFFSIAEMSHYLLQHFFIAFCFKSQILSPSLQFSFSFIFVLFDRMGTSLKLKKFRKRLVAWKLLDSLCLQILVSFVLNYPECFFCMFWLNTLNQRTNKDI